MALYRKVFAFPGLEEISGIEALTFKDWIEKASRVEMSIKADWEKVGERAKERGIYYHGSQGKDVLG